MNTVRLGVDRLIDERPDLGGRRWALLTNDTGVTADLVPSSVAVADARLPVVALLGPEHGLRGTAQAGESEGEGRDPRTGLPVVDTYRLEGAALDRVIADLDVDTLLVDLQDVGVRHYTYVWSMVDCLRSAARLGIHVVVLDRPNPLDGVTVAGPGLRPGFESFIGRIDVPMRHGLTIGEVARVAAALDRAAGHDVPDPTVVTMRGWRRDMLWADTGLAWVLPSPNVPTATTALAYAGTVLVEGTNLSEGRGTTRPFELIGAPWLDERLAARMRALGLPGVRFRATWFEPTFGTWAGDVVGGLQVHVDDPRAFEPLRTATELLLAARALAPEEFAWRTPSWEGDSRRPYFLDLLWGSDSLRRLVEQADGDGIAAAIAEAPRLRARDEALLLYGKGDHDGQ
ncbi:DUF1343 domain-containing protein [uncultured Tessaracoccus sp.]|uniref:exo-beta-N-acetylmuramidase NamZ family protein n=1 Tax=uncultured Tessaracoccus sp. TaxID=905023 RepID=UPI0025ED250C|nr:DUF1343 domain-containing protein [uncultured Tessaracoccus sp.]